MERATEKVRRGFASRNEGVTLFVFNLPENLHWKGLWCLFSYHGDLVDAYILNKRSKRGHRFGFVRYASMEDALRAQERLDGFLIYSYRVRVHLARFDPGRDRGKRRESSRFQNPELENGLTTEKMRGLKSVVGVIDPAKSEILNNCLVGWCNKFQRGGKLARELHKAGIKDVSIMRLQGSAFLLVSQNHERVILTNFSDCINETVELKVASKVYKIRVKEFEPSFTPNSVWCEDVDDSEHIESDDFNGNQKLNEDLEGQEEGSSSSKMNLEGDKWERSEGDGKILKGDVEIQLASDGCSAGLENREERERVTPFIRTSRGVENLKDTAIAETVVGQTRLDQIHCSSRKGIDEIITTKVVKVGGEQQIDTLEPLGEGSDFGLQSIEENKGSDCPFSVNLDCFEGLGNSQAVEDIRMMGLEPLEFEIENASIIVLHDVVPTTQVRECDDALVEGTVVDMLKKVKCIYDYDDEVTTKLRRNLESNVLKRKKGNYGKNKNKAGKEKLSTSNLDSDCIKHKEFLYKEARAALKVGKEVGIRIIGNEEDVIEDMVQEDLKKLDRR
ncbi:hypothetical protein V6N13_054456 [Hibiscus sabdariffa]